MQGKLTIAESKGNNGPLIEWLLEATQPFVRYYTLVDILGQSKDAPEAREAYSRIGKTGWASEILKHQKSAGYWEPREPTSVREWLDFLQFPQYRSTIWWAIVLSDLGMTSKDPKIRKIGELVFKYKLQLHSPVNIFTEEVCIVGNVARMMTRFGYDEDYRIKKLFDWMVEDQKEDGGWNCFSSKVGTLDTWEPLAAFATLPKQKRTRSIKRSIERGVEFYLERRLSKEGKKYPPWFRFHYPVHYFYDILVGLDLVTKLGYAGDKRLKPALELLKRKRQSDGTWLLDAVHPDLAPGANQNLINRAKTGKLKAFALEEAGKPSKWITLTALQVLKRVEDAR